ncbi:glycosyltransferase [Sphingomonas sp.]|uniref:glycosyltransferase n=1 Tax=Sphingomonas sp. TaxID=28214 RepID=UPI002DD666E7|nr:glycosyltransferase [Sphingomonas sp.]
MKVLIAGHVYYDVDNAAMFRVREVSGALQRLGHDVTIVDGLSSDGPRRYSATDVKLERVRSSSTIRHRLGRKFGVGFGFLDANAARERVDIIYCYGSELSWVLSCWRVARRHRARLVLDVTELYGFEEMATSFSTIRTRVGTWIGIFLCVPMLADAVVVPSRRFQRLIARLGKPAHLLPPFFDDLAAGRRSAADANVLVLAYAGSPSNKEWLSLIFRALAIVELPQSKRIDVQLVGLDRSAVEVVAHESGAAHLLEREGVRILARGRVDVAEARAIVGAADFSLVIRHPSIRVNYGFPSKVAEAFRLGTPVIGNAYSDLAFCLEDGRNGLFLRDETDAGLAALFARALAMDVVERQRMREAAAATGRRTFSVEAGASKLRGVVAG